MPINFINEDYNGKSFLQANAGDWVQANVEISMRFQLGSSEQNKVTYNNSGGIYSLTFQNSDWSEAGFVVGDTIVIRYTWIGAPTGFATQTFTTSITYVNGNQLQILDPFVLNSIGGTTIPHANGRQFPTDSFVGPASIVSTRVPEGAEFLFNLGQNGTQTLNSVIDNELNRFEVNNLDSIAVGGSLNMTQLANVSGGLIKDVRISYTYSEGSPSFWRRYRVDFKFWQWGILKSGFINDNPPYYDTSNCLVPISKIKLIAETGNANAVLSITNETTEADTGGWDENYNGGLSEFSVSDIVFLDYLNDPIDAIDYSNPCTFRAKINAPLQNDPLSTYRLGLVWRPIDSSQYSNIVSTNIGENLLLNAPEVDFIANGVVDPTLYQGYTHPTGARWDFQNLQFAITGVDELTIEGKIIPNGDVETLMSLIPNGGRRSTLWVSIGNHLTDTTNTSQRVSLKLFDLDNYDAPTKGIQIPNVIDQTLLDHNLNVINTPLPQTTTEDDVLYQSNFRLVENEVYEGVRARIWAYNDITEENFTLEDIFFSFSNQPYVAGKHEVNFTTNRGFNLPPLSDRNIISLVRDPSLDITGLYALRIDYGYLSRWEYWLEQANVNSFFFDPLQSFNGYNKNWQRFVNGDWTIRLSYYTRKNGVDDFNDQVIGIRPYEDDIDVTTQWSIELLSDNSNPTNLIANELHEITAVLTWSTGLYNLVWGEMTIEDFESGNRWVISSVLDQGGIANNPLKPIAGQNKLNINLTSPNVAELKALVDTSVVDANKVSLSARIYSSDTPPYVWEYALSSEKDAVVAYSDARLLRIGYTGPLMRVRRSSDQAEQDIPFILIGDSYVLDEANLLSFAGTSSSSNAWIVTRYDQGVNNQPATQVAMSSQPPIVVAGVILKDPISNKPAHLCDGVQHFHEIANVISCNNNMAGLHVYTDVVNSTDPKNRIGFGNQNQLACSSLYWKLGGGFNRLFSAWTNPAFVHFQNIGTFGGFISMNYCVPSTGTNSNVEAILNGVLAPTSGQLPTANSVVQHIDAHDKIYHKGYKSEDILFTQDRVNVPQWYVDNANDFYQIY